MYVYRDQKMIVNVDMRYFFHDLTIKKDLFGYIGSSQSPELQLSFSQSWFETFLLDLKNLYEDTESVAQ